MGYRIRYKALDADMNSIKKFLATKGLYSVGSGLTIDLFVENTSPEVDSVFDALEVDVANKTLYYGYHTYSEDETYEDYGTLMTILDMDILKYFDKLGFEMHEHNINETGQHMRDWWNKDE